MGCMLVHLLCQSVEPCNTQLQEDGAAMDLTHFWKSASNHSFYLPARSTKPQTNGSASLHAQNHRLRGPDLHLQVHGAGKLRQVASEAGHLLLGLLLSVFLGHQPD